MKKVVFILLWSICIINSMAQNHEYVDLGLPSGTLWATCNIGADKPHQLGSYFAWGETQGNKKAYNKSTYKFYINYGSTFLKYDNSPESLGENSWCSLEAEDDAATANWGSEWSMPTVEQCEELLKCCEIVEKKVKGKKGLLITGPSGASIFLPFAGVYYKMNKLHQGEEGYYWTKDLSPKVPDIAAFLHLGMLEIRYHERYNGYPIRPVRNTTTVN